MPTKIPDLTLPSSSGYGTLHGKDTERLTTGASVMYRVVDIEIHHPISAQSEATPAEAVFPGFWAEVQMSIGDKTDGARTRQYDPKRGADWVGDCDIEIVPFGGGTTIYKGPAQIRAFKGKALKKGAMCTMSIRLLSVDPNTDRPRLSEKLGAEVEYQIIKVIDRSLPAPVPAGQGALPMVASPGAVLHVDVGDLVTFTDDHGEGSGLALSVNVDTILLTGFLSSEDGGAIEVPRSEVIAVNKICGPAGGEAKSHLETLRDAGQAVGVTVRVAHLLGAIFSHVDEGLEALDQGWPLSAGVRASAVDLAQEEQGEALPPEPSAGEVAEEEFDILGDEVEDEVA